MQDLERLGGHLLGEFRLAVKPVQPRSNPQRIAQSHDVTGELARDDGLLDGSDGLGKRAALLAGLSLPCEHIRTLSVREPGAVLQCAREVGDALAVSAER